MTAPDLPAPAPALAGALEIVQLLVNLVQAQEKYRRAKYALKADYFHARVDFAEGYVEKEIAEQAFWSFATLEQLEPLVHLLSQQPAAQAPAEALAAEIEEHRRWLWLNEDETPERQARDLLHRQLEYERSMRRDLAEAQRWVSAARAALTTAEAGRGTEG